MNKIVTHSNTPQTVIAGLPRILPSVRFSSSRMGDGGCAFVTLKRRGSVSRFRALVGFICVFLFTSCQTELKLAKSFVAEQANTRVAVYFPEQAEVKVEYNTLLDRKTEVLEGFSQDLFLDVMYNAYADMLRTYNLDVYIPEDIENVKVDSTHWLVMLSRMEISGRITEYEDYLFSDTDEYSYKHPLNTVNVASWFEINDGEWRPVQFCEHNLIDGFDSETGYSFWLNQIDYNYSIDTLELNDVYNYAVFLGKLYAGYTYDYMMNSYVGAKMKNLNYYYNVLLRFDPYKKKLRYAAENDGFIELTE